MFRMTGPNKRKYLFMPFNILTDPFFPVLTRDRSRRWIAFADLAASGDDEPLQFEWPRSDFNVAACELAIGVAALAFQPLKPSDWTKLWNDPPNPERTAAAIAPFAHAFALDGDGPRFLQERGGLQGDATPIEALLIDTPGANGQKKNADLLTHRGRYERLGLPAAAMALYALQQFAPSGGAGNRTSMRGGGPLTTLVIPGSAGSERPSLWRLILANLPQHERLEFDSDELPKILPWLAPTLVSDKAHGEHVVSEADDDAHCLQAFFGMPRRIALQFAGEGVCSMTGETVEARGCRSPRDDLRGERAPGVRIFFQQILQRDIVEHSVRQKPLKLRVLVLKLPQPLGLRDLHAAKLRFPGVERRAADPVLG